MGNRVCLICYELGFFGEQEKEYTICVKMGLKNPPPRIHRLSSLGKPRDANRRSSRRIFYPALKLMMRSYMITPGPVEPLSDDVCTAPSELEILDCSTSK